MKTFEKLFIINGEGYLEINKPEVRGIDEFRKVLEKDKGSKGDSDGRKKLKAFKELMYIHLFSSPVSIYRDLPEDIRHANSRRDAGLLATWKPSGIVKEACKKYKELESMSAVYHTYINASRGVYSIGEDLKYFNELKEKARNTIKEKSAQLEVEEIEEERQKLEKAIAYSTQQLMDLGNKIMTLTNSLPNAYNTIEGLHKKVLEETQQGAAIYGGGRLNNREK